MARMEACDFTLKNEKLYGLLLVYFKLVRQVIEHDAYRHKNDMMEKLRFIKAKCVELESAKRDVDDARFLYWKCIQQMSLYDFESFVLYMERNREPSKQFYLPRRETLCKVVESLQKLEDSKSQKMYGLSMPSRVGKSTICLLFLTWIALKRPNSHSALCGHSGTLTKGFFKEILNFMTSEDYTFRELYFKFHPEYAGKPMITEKSAEDYTITLGDADRFATITCRSIDASWTGTIDVSDGGYLYVDDLVRDREHSLNPQRMENTWQEYLNKCVDRKSGSNRLGGAKELMVGTLWNIYDPLNRLKDLYANNPDYVFDRIPALDFETDESNFQYKINGFSTQYYRDMRERLDPAEWMAKYQQSPQIREGILFNRDDMKRFRNAPEEKVTTIGYCDPALGGGDFLSFPISRCIDGENKYYIVDWVYNPSSPKITVPKMVDKVIKWHVTQITIEIDGGAGTLVHKELEEELRRRDCGWCELIPKHSSSRLSKEDKIKGRADFIKERFYFYEDAVMDSFSDNEYKKAFNNTCLYTTMGKNLHDDDADSLAGLALEYKPFIENGMVYVPDINPFRQYY